MILNEVPTNTIHLQMLDRNWIVMCSFYDFLMTKMKTPMVLMIY